MNTRLKIAAGLVLAACASMSQAASASFASGGYSENFDELGTTTSLPSGWSVWTVGSDHTTWTSSITANGSSGSVAAMTLSGTQVASALLDSAITTSTKSTGAYNIAHAATPTDRVLSTSPTGNAGTALQLSLTNDTGSSLSSIVIGYDIVKFYDGNKQSSISSSYPTGEELPGYQLFYSLDGSTWTNVSALNPVSTDDGIHPVVPAGSVNNNGVKGPVDYSVTSVTGATLSFATLWTAGQALQLRWVDDNAVNVSPDQVIGLNNVSLAVAAVPEPETYAMILAGLGLLGAARRRRS